MLHRLGRVQAVFVAGLLAVPFAGAGAALTARAAGADPTVPGAPKSGIVATSGTSGALVSWKAPANNGGSPITGYTVIPFTGYRFQSPATPQVFNSTATNAALTGLAKATAYRFKVVATNAIGSGPASALTAAIVIGTPSQPAKPTVKKGPAKGQLTVAFKAPANNGAPIKGYAATCTPVGNSHRNIVVSGHASPIIVSGHGLTAVRPGNTYTCIVRASNSRGPSVPSPKSAKIKA